MHKIWANLIENRPSPVEWRGGSPLISGKKVDEATGACRGASCRRRGGDTCHRRRCLSGGGRRAGRSGGLRAACWLGFGVVMMAAPLSYLRSGFAL